MSKCTLEGKFLKLNRLDDINLLWEDNDYSSGLVKKIQGQYCCLMNPIQTTNGTIGFTKN